MNRPDPPDRPELDPDGIGEAEARRQRRRRLDDVFGEVLPAQTRDDVDDTDRAGGDRDAGEEWLRRQVPPHHG